MLAVEGKLKPIVMIMVIGFATSACSLIEATTDTTVQVVNGVSQASSDLSSSTTPSDSAEGVEKKIKKLHMYVYYNRMNLRQDVAQGHGEYLTSLGALLEVPPERHEAFGMFAQLNYTSLFDADDRITYDKLIEMANFGSEEMRQALVSYEKDVMKRKG